MLIFLSPGCPKQRTGGYLYNAHLVEALKARGHTVEVVEVEGTWPQGPFEPFDVPAHGVVVADGLLWPAVVEAMPQLRGRAVVLVHSLLEVEGGVTWRGREARALQGVRAVVATGSPTQRGLAAMGIASVLVEPGTQPQARSRPTGQGRLVAVATVTPRKGLRRLVELLRGMSGWELVVVGSLTRDVEEAKAVRELSLGLPVRWLGEVDDIGVGKALQDADLLVHPALYEAYGMGIAEAFARGVPVLCTPAGVAEGGGAEIAEWPSFGDRLRAALADPALLATWSDRSWFRGQQLLSWGDTAQKMEGMLSGFSVQWLAQREPYDHQARSHTLAARFGEAVAGAVVLDLGGGVGSGVRFVAPHCPGVRFVVVDHDEALLEVARSRGLQTLQLDLRTLELPPCGGLHAQALLDLVSWDWLEQLVTWVVARQVPVLAALTVDGRVQFEPVDRDDEVVMAAFRAHQELDRGFGPSPGWQAAERFAELLRAAGWSVECEQTDWIIPETDEQMMRAMVDGIAEAATVTSGDPARVEAWRRRRGGSMRVGHTDVLALPPG